MRGGEKMKVCVIAMQFENASYQKLKALHAIIEGQIHYFDKTSLTIEEANELYEEFVRLYPNYKHWHIKILTDALPIDPVNFHIND